MPNHITNYLTITHSDAKKLEWLLSCFVKDGVGQEVSLDFNKIIPQPENLFKGNLGQAEEEYCKKNNIPNWFDWNVSNWGTKWNSYSGEVLESKKDKIICRFDTAWNPPNPIFERLKEMGFIINGYWVDEGDDALNYINHPSDGAWIATTEFNIKEA